jgi:hypothetical protein
MNHRQRGWLQAKAWPIPRLLISTVSGFVKQNLLGLAFAPIATLYVSENAWAQARGTRGHVDKTPIPPAELDPDNPQAQALNYTTQSIEDGQSCANGQLYTGLEGEELGSCAIFSHLFPPYGQRLVVKATGWCWGWASRQPL